MFSIYKEVWKIVRSSISYMQIAAFTASSLLGVFVVFFAVHCFLDFKNVVKKDTSIFKEEFLIISKNVSVLQTLANKPAQFSKSEISKLEKQKFFKQVSQFESSQFQIKLFTESENLPPIRTDMFFESVPSKYINVSSKDWTWKEGQTFIPIVFPQNFLALYNYGFAPSQGLPQLSEALFSRIPLKIRVNGNGFIEDYDARVVDFSDRINTILVPENFLQWANAKYGVEGKKQPSRLILECDNIADSRIFEYLSQQDYQLNDESLLNSKLAFYLKLTLTIVGLIGLIITLLAVWLLIFSFQLIIEKNKTRMQNLFYMGYSFSDIVMPYNIISWVLNFAIVLVSLVASFYAHSFVIKKLQVLIQIQSNGIIIPLLVAISIFCGIIFLNYISIRRAVKQAVL